MDTNTAERVGSEAQRVLTPLQAWIALRLAQGATQREVAGQLGVAESVLSHIIAGRRRLPRAKIEAAEIVTNLRAVELLR